MASSGALFGTATMATANAAKMVIQIVCLPVIGRLLGPQAYGQIALVTPFVIFSLVIAESGLGACIVRAKETSRELEGTVFLYSMAFSLLIIAVFSFAAFPIGNLLNEPMFGYLLIAMSSILLLASLNIVPVSLLLRDQRYEWIAVSDIASVCGGLVCVVAGILMGWGVWSLVAQQIGFWLCKIAVVFYAARRPPSFRFSAAVLRENIHFGLNLMGTSIISFLSKNVDRVIVGAFLGTHTLGFYALAFQIITMPQTIIAGSIYYAMFASISEAHRSGRPMAPYFLRMMRGVMLVGAPLLIGIAVTASLWVPLLLGDDWLPIIHLILLFAPAGLFLTLEAALGGVLVGLGRTDLVFRVTLLNSSITVLAILLGVFISVEAVAALVSVATIIGFLIEMRVTARECEVPLSDVASAASGPLTAAVVMGLGVLALQDVLTAGLPLLAGLSISVVAGAVLFAAVLFAFFRNEVMTDIASVRDAIAARRAVG